VVSHDERLMEFADEIWRIVDGRLGREVGARALHAPMPADAAHPPTGTAPAHGPPTPAGPSRLAAAG